MRRLCTFLMVLAVGLMIGCQKEAGDQAAELMVITDSVPSADSVMIHYEAHGSGDRGLVLVHGWCGDRSYWARQIESFKDEYRVVAIDLAGHGESGTNRKEWTVERFGDDVAAVVNALGLKEVALAGHSMSGAVCIEAARRLPEQTVVLIGVDTYQRITGPFAPEEIEAFVAPFREDFAGQTREFIAGIFGPNADSTLVTQVVEDIVKSDPAIAIAIFENLFPYDGLAALKDMRKPIRAVNGDLWATDVEYNRQLVESFDAEIVEGSGHFPHLEKPGAFNVALRKVLHEFWPPKAEN